MNVDVDPTTESTASTAFCYLGWKCVQVTTRPSEIGQPGIRVPSDVEANLNCDLHPAHRGLENIKLYRSVHFACFGNALSLRVLEDDCWRNNRPWVLIVNVGPDATAPTQIWESYLTAKTYHFVYADFHHRIYLANEHKHLEDALQEPPNIFDNFNFRGDSQDGLGDKRHHEAANGYLRQTERMRRAALLNRTLVQKLGNDLACADTESLALSTELKAVKAELASLKAELESVYASTSWRMTYPLRLFIICLLIRIPKKIREFGAHSLRKTLKYVYRSPRLVKYTRHAAQYFPGVKKVLQRIAPNTINQNINENSVDVNTFISNSTENMSLRAQQIFSDLSASTKIKSKD